MDGFPPPTVFFIDPQMMASLQIDSLARELAQQAENLRLEVESKRQHLEALLSAQREVERENLSLKQEIERIPAVRPKRRYRRRKISSSMRKFSCPFRNCSKRYVSSIALRVHLKNFKHDVKIEEKS